MTLDNYKYNLKNLKNCRQYWDEMDPIAGGRLCAKCEKKIVDFSGMSFSEIAVFMSESEDAVCGFYLPQQLKDIQSTHSKFPVAAAISTLMATTAFAENTTARLAPIENLSSRQPNGKPVLSDHISGTDIKADTFYISGRVEYFDSISRINRPAEFASVIVKDANLGVTTDKNGNFKLGYQRPETGTISLRISSVGFMTYEITDIELKDKTEIDLGTIKMEKRKEETIEFYVTMKKRTALGRFWRKITRVFR